MAVPIAIARQMRKPTSSPEPNDNRLQLKPIFIGCHAREQTRCREPVCRKLVRIIKHARGQAAERRVLSADRRGAFFAAFVQHEDRLARSQAIRISQILFIDVVTAHRNGQQDAEQAGAAKPEKNLRGAEMNRRIEHALGVEHVKSRQQHAHESSLSGARAHGLHDVVFARVGVRSDAAERPGHERMNPRNADTTERFGPKPSFKTQ